MSESYHVLCCINDVYAQHCGVLLCSLFSNNRDLPFTVHILTTGVSVENRSKLTRLADSYHHHLFFYTIDMESYLFPKIEGHYISIETYLRLLVADYIPETIEKIVYLDVDMLVVDNIASLLNEDMEGCTIGAIEDCVQEERYNRLDIPQRYGYFNAGVLLIDMVEWRRANMTQKALDFISEHPTLLFQHDQDVLNALLYNSRKRIGFRWNMLLPFFQSNHRLLPQFEEELMTALRNPAIVHFTGGVKPWMAWEQHPYHSWYYKYLEKTPWRGYRPSFSSRWHAYPFPRNILGLLMIDRILIPIKDKIQFAVNRIYKIK